MTFHNNTWSNVKTTKRTYIIAKYLTYKDVAESRAHTHAHAYIYI